MTPAKFIQIVTLPASECWPAALYALDEDGAVWEFVMGAAPDDRYWRRVPMERES